MDELPEYDSIKQINIGKDFTFWTYVNSIGWMWINMGSIIHIHPLNFFMGNSSDMNSIKQINIGKDSGV